MDDEASLRAAIVTYYRALTLAAHDPKHRTDSLARLIAPDCECRQVVDLLRNEARQGRYLDYSYAVRDVRVVAVGDLGGDATYVVVQTAGHERSGDGTVLHSYPASTERFSAHFSRRSNGWILTRAARVR
jgi:hypothetical protein